MLKKLLSGLFWVLLANLLIKPFWILGIEVGVQNAVGADQYGYYIDIFNIAYIFNILLDIGITNFNTRNIAQHPHLISKHLPSILSMKIMLLGLYLLATFTVGLLSGYDTRQFKLLAILSLNQFLNSLILYLRSNFEGLLLFKWDSLLSILDRLVMILICGALLWLPHHPQITIEYFVYAQTAAYLVTAVIALILLWRKTGSCRLRFRRAFSLAILRQSAPYALLVLLMASYNRIDPLLLKRLSPHDIGNLQAGIYAGAFRLLDALTMLAYLVSIPLLPIYSKLCAQRQAHPAETHRQITDTTRLIFSLMMVYSITAAASCSHLAPQLMSLFYHDHIPAYTSVFRILILGIIPISCTYVFGTLLTANGNLRQLNILAATTLLANIAINILLIPRIGATGSAWASLSAQSLMAITQLILALSIFNIRPSAIYILKMALFTLLTLAIVAHCPGQLWLQIMATAILSLTISILLNIINPSQLINIIKQKDK